MSFDTREAHRGKKGNFILLFWDFLVQRKMMS